VTIGMNSRGHTIMTFNKFHGLKWAMEMLISTCFCKTSTVMNPKIFDSLDFAVLR
jgi:hypothetical protein